MSEVGTRRPSSETTPTAKAMSVAIGIPQPVEAAPDRLNARKMRAGTTMPPRAAATGSMAARGRRSSPVTISLLISRPTTKKKTAIRTSFTNPTRVSECPSWSSDTTSPNARWTSVCQKS